MTKTNPAVIAAKQEMASRILSRRKLLPFIQRMNPKYMPGWVHEDICRRLEQFSDGVAKGLSPRLMLLCPPRSGKSEIASKNFPAWHLGRQPDHEIIACSYNVGLAMDFSKRIKALLEDAAYQTVFDARLDPDNKSSESWGLYKQPGSYVAAGVGGGINGKGAHCLPGHTKISTVGGLIDIGTLYQLKSVPDLITPLGIRRALAITRRSETALYELRFSSGAIMKVTGKHPIYLPDRAAYVTAEDLYGETEADGRHDVRVVRESVQSEEMRPREVGSPGQHGVLLRQSVQPGASRGQERQTLLDVQEAGVAVPVEPKCDVLLGGLPAAPKSSFSAENLPAVRRGISAVAFVAGLLRTGLREYGAQATNDWTGELELRGRHFVRVLVRPDAGASAGTGQKLHSVWRDREIALSPCERGSAEQYARKPDHALCRTSSGAPQVYYDTLSMVRRCSAEPVEVYDLQVEEAGCFFADGILVGNCLIIDDPLKNAEEADSATTREAVWNWYGSTAYTRLAPGGGVLIIQTWWHDDDLAGRLQAEMAAAGPEDMDVDRFVVIKYPAIAEHDEYLDYETDAIVYDQLPEQGRLLRAKGEALHPDRFDLKKLLGIKRTIPARFWSALYQQNPVPDDGAFFTKDQFKRAALPPSGQCYVHQAWDFAISTKQHNDYTVGSCGLQDDDDVLHVAEVVRFKSGDAFHIVESILGLAKRWYHPSLRVGVEDGQIWRSIEALMKKRMKEMKFYPSIVVLKPITDKQARASTLQGRMQQGMVSFNIGADWYDTVRNEMLRFPAGVHDDCVDSLAWLAQVAVGRTPPQKKKDPKQKSWRDKLHIAGGNVGHMAA